MSDEGQQTVQLWVRTEKAQVYGPLSATSVELLFDNGIIQGRVQVSIDGLNYVFPGRVPGVRMFFPRELWGEAAPGGEEVDAQWSTVVLPPAIGAGAGPAPTSERGAAPVAAPRVPGRPPASNVPGPPPPGVTRAPRPPAQVRNPVVPGAQPPPAPAGPVTAASLFADLAPPVAGPPSTRPPGPPVSSSPSTIRAPVVGPPVGSSPSTIRAPAVGPPVGSPSTGSRPAEAASARGPVGGTGENVPGSRAAEAASPRSPAGGTGENVPGSRAAEAASPRSPAGGTGVAVPSRSPAAGTREPGSSPSSVRVPAVAGPAPQNSPSTVRAANPPSGSRPSLASSGPTPAPVPATAASSLDRPPPELPAAGSLLEHSARRLYGVCACTNATALLTLELGDRALSIHFKRGAPEFVDSTHPDDSLEAFLLAQGLATPAQLGAAEAQKARFGGELLPALFGLGLINPNAAFQQLAERSANIVLHAFLTERGNFTVQLIDLPASKSMPLGNRWAVYLEALRKVPMQTVVRQMSTAMDLPIMRAEGIVAMSELKLLPQEARALTFFDGTRTLGQVQHESALEGDVCTRTAWMLGELELVSFAAVAPAHGAAHTAAPPPAVAPAPSVLSAMAPPVIAPTAPPIAPAGARAPPSMPAGVRAPAAGAPPGAPARSSVPYPGNKPAGPPAPQVLSPPAAAPPPVVPPAPARPIITPAGTAPIRPAAPTLTPAAPPTAARPAAVVPAAPPQASSPSSPGSSELPQLQATLERLKKQNHFEVLGVPKTADSGAVKVAYLKLAKSYHPDTVPPGSPEAVAKAKADIFALIGEANRTLSDERLRAEYLAEVEAGTAGEKVDVSQLLLAEELFQRGCVLVKAKKFPEAVKTLDDAIRANAHEGEYLGWRGYAKYFTYTDKSKAFIEAMKDITASLKLNPNAAAVHYFNGFLLKATGELPKAKAAFKRCVELDPRHIDAQRELRMMK